MASRTEELERFVAEPAMFRLTPVANLISEQRQFVACYERPKVDFIQKLMGMKSLTHLRFEDSDSECNDKCETTTSCAHQTPPDPTHTHTCELNNENEQKIGQ